MKEAYINGLTWRIYLTTDVERLRRADGTITLGVTDINDKTICIFSKMSPFLINKVLLHELCHAFIFSYGYDLTLEEEELLCSFMDTYAVNIIEEADRLMQIYTREIL